MENYMDCTGNFAAVAATVEGSAQMRSKEPPLCHSLNPLDLWNMGAVLY